MVKFLVLFMLSSSAFAGGFGVLMQTGAYSGMLTIGTSYESYEYNLSTQLLVGYVPGYVGGEDIYSFSSKNIWHPVIYGNTFTSPCRPYIGVNFIFSLFDSDTFILQPSQYPASYYPPNGVRAAPIIGFEAWVSNGSSLYVEVTALDLYLETLVRSEYNMKTKDVFTYGFGLKVEI